jgi:hypothetical protein
MRFMATYKFAMLSYSYYYLACTLPSIILTPMGYSPKCLIAKIGVVQVWTNYMFSENR